MPGATSSGADGAAGSSNGGTTRNREHNQGNQERVYTVEQEKAVLRIRRCKATDFYDILALDTVKTTCTDAEIKKAYRKQSLLTHPDKNGHEHAAEAFKMVARAFSVLGDKDKRAQFDRFGTDPDSRSGGGGGGGGGGNPISGFAARSAGRPGAGGGGMWEDEISPEEMFQRFFGGGGFQFGGGGFDTGPGFVFNLGGGPGGVRVHQFGGPRMRRRPRQGEQEESPNVFTTLMGLLPILFLFVLPLISSLFSGESSRSTPAMVFDTPVHPYTLERVTPNVGVRYYTNPKDTQGYNVNKLAQLDKTAEITLVKKLRLECESEYQQKQRLVEQAQGWFFQDPDKMEIARKFELKSCKRLESLGMPR